MPNKKRCNIIEGACEKKSVGDLGNALTERDRCVLQNVLLQDETYFRKLNQPYTVLIF